MNHTTNYHLPQFEETDRIHHDDFNDAFATVDAALSEKPFVIGTYTGDGKSMEEGGQVITIGFQPRLVIVSQGHVDYGFQYYSNIIGPNPTGRLSTGKLLTDGFQVATSYIASYQGDNINMANNTYYYIAFR